MKMARTAGSQSETCRAFRQSQGIYQQLPLQQAFLGIDSRLSDLRPVSRVDRYAARSGLLLSGDLWRSMVILATLGSVWRPSQDQHTTHRLLDSLYRQNQQSPCQRCCRQKSTDRRSRRDARVMLDGRLQAQQHPFFPDDMSTYCGACIYTFH